MKALTLLAAAFVTVAPPVIAQDVNSAIDQLIDSAGLQSLQGQERDAVRALVRRLLVNRASSNTLTTSAKKYLESEGYEPVHLSTVYANGDHFLVARTGARIYATADIPLGLSAYLFSDGEYFAKTSLISGGISEFIDEDGGVQSLMLAKWSRIG